MNPAQAIPTLVGSERDSDGRLVKLVFDSTPPLMRPGVNPWLVAVDGSDNSLRAIGEAAKQAAAMNDCALHLLHVQPWMSKEAAETEFAPHALAATARARGELDAAAMPWRLHVVMGDPAEQIIQHAVALQAAGIVIGSRGLNIVQSLMFGSVAYKVMHLSPVSVMVVP